MDKQKLLIGSAVLALGVIGIVAYKRMGAGASNSSSLLPTVTASTGSGSGSSTATQQPTAQTTQRVSTYPEGTLLRYGNDSKVYIIDAVGYRHWISNRNYFDRQGYKMADVKSITIQQMMAIPEASPLAGLAGLR